VLAIRVDPSFGSGHWCTYTVSLYPSLCMLLSVCLPVCLSACLPVCLSVCLSGCRSVCLSV
jgi:hypothetical protein